MYSVKCNILSKCKLYTVVIVLHIGTLDILHIFAL